MANKWQRQDSSPSCLGPESTFSITGPYGLSTPGEKENEVLKRADLYAAVQEMVFFSMS